MIPPMPPKPLSERDRPDELRVPLKARGMRGELTDFEGNLFNLVTKLGPVIPGLFGNRLRVVQAMLNAMDDEIQIIKVEHKSFG